MTKKYKTPKLLNYFFVSSAALAFLFILNEYTISQSESSGMRVLNTHFYKEIRPRDLVIYPLSWNLIDLKVQYLFNNLVCQQKKTKEEDKKSSVFMLILITSHAGDFKLRNHLRQIFTQNQLKRIQMRRLFLLAKPHPLGQYNSSNKYSQVNMNQILEENKLHRDILMGDFYESYRNLTYKHLMGLQWVQRYCPEATFILKQDDDIFVDFYQLWNLLKIMQELFWTLKNRHIIWGKALSNQEVIRDSNSKWYVPQNKISTEVYPDFVSGWGYVTTPKVLKEIVEVALREKYFWIDDVHLTGLIREKTQTKIELLDMSEYFTIYKGQLQCCIATTKVKSKSVVNFNRNKPYWCDYLIGTTNGDLELMEILQQHSRFCHKTTHTCGRREDFQKLNRTCIVTNNMIVNNFSHYIGKELKSSKPRGSWKSIKL